MSQFGSAHGFLIVITGRGPRYNTKTQSEKATYSRPCHTFAGSRYSHPCWPIQYHASPLIPFGPIKSPTNDPATSTTIIANTRLIYDFWRGGSLGHSMGMTKKEAPIQHAEIQSSDSWTCQLRVTVMGKSSEMSNPKKLTNPTKSRSEERRVGKEDRSNKEERREIETE